MTQALSERSRGSVIGSYELLDRIGEGGMGEVWKARDRLLDRVVALKFLTGPASARHDLLHEARAASALNHPNIVTVFQIGESGGDSYLAMEFIEGESLRRRIGAPHDMTDALEISEQIVDGLASAHARGIIHRDLKPENIMIRVDGHVKLVDFGLAKQLPLDNATTTSATGPGVASRSGELIGTCSYMSPEQVRGHAISTTSDVFSLGIVMYELFSGRHPFRHDEVLETLNAIVRLAPPPLAPPEAPAQVGDIVSRALQKDPSRRYSSAVEISEPIKSARREWDREGQTSPVPARPVSPWARGSAAAALVAMLVAGGWSIVRSTTATDASRPNVRSMAVMPFRTADQNAVMLAEALPEDLGSALSKAGFQVASRTGVLQIGASSDVRAAALELGVDGVLDGVVRVQGASVRIYVELVSARTGFQIWSGTFTADTAALIAGSSIPVTQIAEQIRVIAGGQP